MLGAYYPLRTRAGERWGRDSPGDRSPRPRGLL